MPADHVHDLNRPGMPPHRELVDALTIAVPASGTVFVVSDVHLPPRQTRHSAHVCRTVAAALSALPDPVTVVLAGDILELLGNPETSPQTILDAHPLLVGALCGVRERGGRVVYVVGNHDVRLAWDAAAAGQVRAVLGVELVLQADLVLPADEPLRLRIEHGHGQDPFNIVTDPRDPLDTPLGHHVVTDVLPRLSFLGAGRGVLPADGDVDAAVGGEPDRWLSGAGELVDPLDFPGFVGSRLVYRRLTVHLPWVIAVVVGVALIVRLSLLYGLVQRLPEDVSTAVLHSAYFVAAAVVDAALLLAVLAVAARRVFRSVSSLDLGPQGAATNQAGQAHARQLAVDGYHGYLCGHTHRPELAALACQGGTPTVVFANTGCGTAAVVPARARLGLPPVYLRALQLSWLEVGNDGTRWVIRLRTQRVPLKGSTRLERLLVADRELLTVGSNEQVIPIRLVGVGAAPEGTAARG